MTQQVNFAEKNQNFHFKSVTKANFVRKKMMTGDISNSIYLIHIL